MNFVVDTKSQMSKSSIFSYEMYQITDQNSVEKKLGQIFMLNVITWYEWYPAVKEIYNDSA